VAEEAVQVHRHRQLGSDPAGLGEAPALQVAAGQLGQGIGPALAAAAFVAGVGRAGQGLQRRQQGLAGLGVQQPVEGDHALDGGRQPQAALLVLPLDPVLGGVGVGDQPQMGDGPPQPWRVQAPGRVHQDRFGVGGDMVGEVVGAGGEHLGVGHRELPVGRGLGGAGQRSPVPGPGGAHEAGGGAGAHAQPGPQPGSRGGGRDALFGAGGPAGVHGGQLS
jgi:hypothetical protein